MPDFSESKNLTVFWKKTAIQKGRK